MEVPMDGLLSDVPLHERVRSRGRTVGEGDFAQLSNALWTIGEQQTDEEAMRATDFGGRILAGVAVLGVCVGLAGMTALRPLMARSGYRIIALLGLEEVRFPAPVHVGDTLRVEVVVEHARETSRPGRG